MADIGLFLFYDIGLFLFYDIGLFLFYDIGLFLISGEPGVLGRCCVCAAPWGRYFGKKPSYIDNEDRSNQAI